MGLTQVLHWGILQLASCGLWACEVSCRGAVLQFEPFPCQPPKVWCGLLHGRATVRLPPLPSQVPLVVRHPPRTKGWSGMTPSESYQNTLMIPHWENQSLSLQNCCTEQFWHFQQCFPTTTQNHSMLSPVSQFAFCNSLKNISHTLKSFFFFFLLWVKCPSVSSSHCLPCMNTQNWSKLQLLLPYRKIVCRVYFTPS